jgi:5-methylcytosine-specific restriction endonuclease McrA
MGTCRYCGSTWQTEDDHVIAESKRGKRTVPAWPYRWSRIKKHNYGKKNDIARKVQKIRDEG